MQLLTRRVEESGDVYPYKQEEWLRYLLPSLWRDHSKPLVLLTGPSTVREDLLVEWFKPAFPGYRVNQGALSRGTLADVMAGLEYIERAYGARALPRVMVLGLSTRFLAEIPRQGRPFAMGLERYSPYFRVRGGNPVGFGLEPKSPLDGAVARARFIVRKQQERYATMSDWLLAQVVSQDLSTTLLGTRLMHSGWARFVLSGRAAHIGIHRYALELATPYKYRNMPAGAYSGSKLTGVLDDPNSIWKDVWTWDLSRDAPAVRARINALIEYASRHNIEMYVVNLPEGSGNRVRYHAGLADAYASLVHSAFGNVPMLDLYCLLDDNGFHDTEHARLPGARRISFQVIGFMHDVRAARALGPLDSTQVADIARKWQATDCTNLKRNHE
jgi:hypothetical protein